jgi:hypothetical protein
MSRRSTTPAAKKRPAPSGFECGGQTATRWNLGVATARVWLTPDRIGCVKPYGMLSATTFAELHSRIDTWAEAERLEEVAVTLGWSSLLTCDAPVGAAGARPCSRPLVTALLVPPERQAWAEEYCQLAGNTDRGRHYHSFPGGDAALRWLRVAKETAAALRALPAGQRHA